MPSKQRKHLGRYNPDARDLFPDSKDISDKDCEEASHAIYMDFGNYTIGHLVPGRGNCMSMNHLGYKEIRRKIEWRITNLGYKAKDFEAIDRWIGEDNWRRSSNSEAKVDRYGKKYSWIAYFEMYGLLQQRGLLCSANLQKTERCSDCDIDPSFPEPARKWKPALQFCFPCSVYGSETVSWVRDGPTPDYTHLLRPDIVDGIHGPWVLLDGFIQESSETDRRDIFTFLRGLLVSANDLKESPERISTQNISRERCNSTCVGRSLHIRWRNSMVTSSSVHT